MLVSLNYFNFNREVVQNKKKVVILFGMPWCRSCDAFLPTFTKWSKKYTDFDFKVCDTSKSKYLTKKFKIVAPMTFVVMDGKKEINRFVGIQNEETFEYYLLKKSLKIF